MIGQLKGFLDKNYDQYKVILASKVPFDNELRKLCEKNTCGQFGRSWTCPPAVGSLEYLQGKLTGFDHLLIFSKVYALENCFDWEGMMTGVKDFQSRISQFKKRLRQDRTNFLIVGAGSCQMCESCTYPEQKPCRFPEDAQYTVESFGIDAMNLMIQNDLKYNNGPNTVTYIGGLFYA